MKRILLYSLITVIVLTGCSDLFQSKIAMDTDTAPSNLAQMIITTAEDMTLGTPSQLFVTHGTYNDKIVVSWNAVANAQYYRLERAVVLPGVDGSYAVPEDFTVLQKFCYATTYTDTILVNPKNTDPEYTYRYYYRVCAENPRGGYEPGEFTVPGLSDGGYLFAPVSGVTADKGKSISSIKITWNKAERAAFYEIYRSTNEDGSFAVNIGRVHSNMLFYTDTINADEQGIEFYYCVYAVNDSNNQSAVSNLGMGFSAVEGAPPVPEHVTVTSGRGTSLSEIAISWEGDTTVADAATQKIDFIVYRSSSQDSSFTVLKKGLTARTYTDKANLQCGVYYYYYIQSVLTKTNSDGTQEILKSSFSQSGLDSESPAEGFILSPPDSVFVEDGAQDGYVELQWTPSIGSAAEQEQYVYVVYADTLLNGTFTEIVTVENLEYDSESGVYRCQTIKKPFFKIAVTNPAAENIQSKLSSTVAPSPAAASGLAATQALNLAAGGASMTANGNNVYPVKVTWTASPGGADGYFVYRSTKPDSGFRLITDTPLSDTYYIDANESAKPGIRYYYKVLALNVLQQGSHYSAVETGYGALTPEQYFVEYNKTVKSSQKKLKLMHKSNDMDKLGSESAAGTISGSLSYNAAVAGLGARITMHYDNYADFYIGGDKDAGTYFLITGDTNTSASMDASGTMDGTVTCTGMYPGTILYNNIKIKAGAAGGGSYNVTMNGFTAADVDWTWGDK